MVKAPTPEEEDRRRLCRERKVLTAERVLHVNRIKGLLFCQGITGYEPLHRDRRVRLEELRTGDGRALPGVTAGGVARAGALGCPARPRSRWPRPAGGAFPPSCP